MRFGEQEETAIEYVAEGIAFLISQEFLRLFQVFTHVVNIKLCDE